MLRKLTYNQLRKIKTQMLPNFDEYTYDIKISKKSNEITNITATKAYLIELADYIINPPNGFNLHANWNKNIAPKDKYLYALVLQDIGKMIKVKSYGYDLENRCILMNSWEGWLPKKSINVIKEVSWRR